MNEGESAPRKLRDLGNNVHRSKFHNLCFFLV